MNYFAHAFRFIGRPRFVTGTALPDWLSVVNRRLRFRPQRLDPAALHADQNISELMAGIKQHLEDDSRFHNCEAFSRCLVAVLQEVRPFLNGVGIPPVFLSHLLVEVLLDAQLVRTRQADVSRYYADLESVDPDWTEWATGEILGQSVSGLAHFIRLFCRERILFDYADNMSLLRRLNQVMRRLRLPNLSDSFQEAVEASRPIVTAHTEELLRALDGWA
ncbi:hypothetical protein THTE_3777 [Thermogutta terrifontis]|uniref:Uncharacterized protein n=1 Tax=Thermogutta terrifontis TaxID=1331910 RepID=A0A286RKB3_9BACT|nr:hypothetical protein [Thermogutta terrifontis]ASV76378.1 hypothetical protein THTE_3777 [Thermogutta terrifontis]